MQIAGNDFFPRPRFTGDEHADLGVRDLPHHLPNEFNFFALPNQTAKHIVVTDYCRFTKSA